MKAENPGAVPESRWQRGWRAFVDLQAEAVSGDIEWFEGLRAAFGISLPAAVGLLANHLVWGIICSFATLWLLMCDVGGAYRQKAINLVSSGVVILCAYIFGGWMILSVPNYITGMFRVCGDTDRGCRECGGASRDGQFDDRGHLRGAFCSERVRDSPLALPHRFQLGASAFARALAPGTLHADSSGALSQLRQARRSERRVLVGSSGAGAITNQPGVRHRLRRSDDQSGAFSQHSGPSRGADRPKHGTRPHRAAR